MKDSVTPNFKAEQAEKAEQALRLACEDKAVALYSKEQMKKYSNEHKGLWYLPLTDDAGNIAHLGIFKPISRAILSYSMQKAADQGPLEMIEECMRQCWIAGDIGILDDDALFIAAFATFQKMMEGYSAHLLKR